MSRPSLGPRCRNLFKSAFTQRRRLTLHEHQAQDLLAQYQIPVPRGHLAATPAEVAFCVPSLGGEAVIKAQILDGERGKGNFANGFKPGLRLVSSYVTAVEHLLSHRRRY